MRDRRQVDAEHLKLLAIFHYVGAGFAVIALLFLFAHYSFVNFFFNNPRMWKGQKGGPPPAEIFAVFRWFYLLGAVWFFASGVMNLVSAQCLRNRKHRVFSLTVAGINCVYMPLGAVLGVFTIVVLARESVRELYEAPASSPP
ncbi:MAG TPA: hypothetical protein VFJ90_01785 [Candidatus Didemnitutus sp.]|nr:hypothetical protein [Candidatus Didemnitutus sp.]